MDIADGNSLGALSYYTNVVYSVFVIRSGVDLADDCYYGPIFLRRFRLYVLSFMFRFMFANICFEKNQNMKIYVMFIINIT